MEACSRGRQLADLPECRLWVLTNLVFNPGPATLHLLSNHLTSLKSFFLPWNGTMLTSQDDLHQLNTTISVTDTETHWGSFRSWQDPNTHIMTTLLSKTLMGHIFEWKKSKIFRLSLITWILIPGSFIYPLIGLNFSPSQTSETFRVCHEKNLYSFNVFPNVLFTFLLYHKSALPESLCHHPCGTVVASFPHTFCQWAVHHALFLLLLLNSTALLEILLQTQPLLEAIIPRPP